MGIKYNSFDIRGIDVSQFNGVIDWSKVQANFSAIRVGYGNTIDSKFVENITNASKQDLDLAYYWYMDYYNNHISTSSVYGMSDADWGRKQADNCWNAIKDNPAMVFIDVESTTGNYAPKIETVQERAQTIMGGFLSRMDELNKRTNGIYCSLGLLSWFYSKWRNRPLWVAWYPYRYVNDLDASDVIYSVKAQGWLVNPIIWQYASDGDIDDNRSTDGQTMGMQYDFLDLNGWVGTKEQYTQMFGQIDTHDDEVIPIPTNTRNIPIMSVIRPVSLRKQPVISFTTFITLLPTGTKLDCLERKIIGSNVWWRVGINQWVAEYNNGLQYLT
jgi:GH25 family lysozyme M1 (1,4-beta-N-acetylmuramidase)